MGSIKDRNGMDLKEAADIRKRCKNTQKNCTKKIFLTQIIMIVWSLTYSQTSWNVKSLWTKLVEVMALQLSCFKSWKTMLWKSCIQYASKFGKLSSGHRTGKGQFSLQSQRKAMQRLLKLLYNCTHLNDSKVMLKILQARLQQIHEPWTPWCSS